MTVSHIVPQSFSTVNIIAPTIKVRLIIQYASETECLILKVNIAEINLLIFAVYFVPASVSRRYKNCLSSEFEL